MNYEAILNGKLVAKAIAYATLETQFKGTSALIKNRTTGAEWYADQESLAAQAAERIERGEAPEDLVHRIFYPDGEAYALSSSISVGDYQRNGYTESYRTLEEVALGCWD